MSANLTSAYTIYTGTPGAGDWIIDCRLSGLAAGANTFTWTATVNGITVNGAAQVLTKDSAQTTMQAIVPIHCAASEVVVVTVLSSSGSDTAVTASSTLAYASVNVAQVGGTTQTGRDLGASVLISSGTGAGQLSVTGGVVAASGNWYSGTPPTAASIATAVWQDLLAGTDFTTSLSVGVGINAIIKALGVQSTVASTVAAGAALGLPLANASGLVPATVPSGQCADIYLLASALATQIPIALTTNSGAEYGTMAIHGMFAGSAYYLSPVTDFFIWRPASVTNWVGGSSLGGTALYTGPSAMSPVGSWTGGFSVSGVPLPTDAAAALAAITATDGSVKSIAPEAKRLVIASGTYAGMYVSQGYRNLRFYWERTDGAYFISYNGTTQYEIAATLGGSVLDYLAGTSPFGTYHGGTVAAAVVPSDPATSAELAAIDAALPAVDSISGVNYAKSTVYGYMGALIAAATGLPAKICAAVAQWFGVTTPTGTVNDTTALSTQIANLNNLSALANVYLPSPMILPASGSTVYPYTVTVKDEEGHQLDLDSSAVPTMTATNQLGTSRSDHASVATRVSIGLYAGTYTVASTDTADTAITLKATGTAATVARLAITSVGVQTIDDLAAIAGIAASLGTPVEGHTVAGDAATAATQATAAASSAATAASNTTHCGTPLQGGALVKLDPTDTTAATVAGNLDAKLSLRPTNPLLTNDARLPATLIASEENATANKQAILDAVEPVELPDPAPEGYGGETNITITGTNISVT